MSAIRFDVPGTPLSVNAMYKRSSHGRLCLTSEGEGFKRTLAMYAREARQRLMGGVPFLGPVEVWIRSYFPSERNDTDGPCKPILDALQVDRQGKGLAGGLIGNDRQARRVVIESEVDAANPRAQITLNTAPVAGPLWDYVARLEAEVTELRARLGNTGGAPVEKG